MLRERCLECGLVSADVVVADVAGMVRSSLPRWQAVLARPDALERPAPEVWSPTEYACHVRDVFTIFAERLGLMLGQDDPAFANWDQDVTAIEDDYASQRPADVAPQLVAAGETMADVLDTVRPGDLGRTGRRSNGSAFTVETLAQYFWHDVAHHLHDVRG